MTRHISFKPWIALAALLASAGCQGMGDDRPEPIAETPGPATSATAETAAAPATPSQAEDEAAPDTATQTPAKAGGDVEPAPRAGLYAKPGFVTEIEDGRLWVLRPGEQKSGKHVTLVGKGPAGMTIKAPEKETALEYLAAKPGFVTEIEDGRLWVLRPGEQKSGKHVTLVGKGPAGMTIKAPEKETALEYLAAKPGFVTEIEDGRLWVLRPGEQKSGKHVTLIGKGPAGMTVKALDRETAEAYLAAGG